jgi:hypothetical protein
MRGWKPRHPAFVFVLPSSIFHLYPIHALLAASSLFWHVILAHIGQFSILSGYGMIIIEKNLHADL